jgi:hypothetical protein
MRFLDGASPEGEETKQSFPEKKHQKPLPVAAAPDGTFQALAISKSFWFFFSKQELLPSF